MTKQDRYRQLEKVSDITIEGFKQLDRATQDAVVELVREPTDSRLAKPEKQVAESRASQLENHRSDD